MNSIENLIVVGVDDSKGARAALDFALDEGVARGWRVEVVTAWLLISPFESLDEIVGMEEGQRIAQRLQDTVLREALEGRESPPFISQLVAHDTAGALLLTRAAHATMLVVGSGRKNLITRAMVGSTSTYCLRHSSVPVVVVPDPERTEPHASGALFDTTTAFEGHPAEPSRP